MGLLIGLSVLLLAACGGEEAAKGGADQEHKKKEIGSLRVENASGDSAHCGQRCTLNSGQIAFGRHPEYGQLQSAIFTMNLDGSHVSQITHPPRGLSRRLSGVVRRWAEARLRSPEHRGRSYRRVLCVRIKLETGNVLG